MSRHKVRVHNWVNGVLQVADHFFENFDLAFGFANNTKGHSIKVYDENDQIVQHIQNSAVDTNTYA